MKLALQCSSESRTEDISLFPNAPKYFIESQVPHPKQNKLKLSVKLALQCISKSQTEDIGLFPNATKYFIESQVLWPKQQI